MNAAMWERAKQLLADAAERPEAERERYVVDHCPDLELRREILAMLATPAPLSDIVAAGGLKPGDHLGPYRIEQLLGRGGMGDVYRARDTGLNRDVALKVLPDAFTLDSDRLARFKREAQVLASLNHPNIAAIYGVEESDGMHALVLELVDGTPLSSRIGRHGLTRREALKLSAQIAAGLEGAHHAGVVHRDLKPANVMVTAAGIVKLVDFGLAKVLQAAGAMVAGARTNESGPHTEAGQILGTVAYMSPEQVRGEPIDSRSDLFSFGALLHEMLTGRRPFDAEDKVSTLSAILHREPAPLSTSGPEPIPRELERIVLRCLRKDRERRFQTASDLKLALEDLEEDSGRTAATMPADAAQRARRSRPAWMRWTLALAAATAVGVGAVWLWRAPRERPTPPLRQVTFDAGIAMMPALSPDGKLFAYASDRSGEGQLDIWLKQVAGGEAVRLTTGPDSKVNPQFSPDGTRVYFLGGRNEIFEVPALGGSSRRVIEDAGPFSVSGHGDIAFHRPGTGTRPGPMFVLPAGAPTAQPWHPECVSAGAPAWSPDGSRIAFHGACRPFDRSITENGFSEPGALAILVGAVGGGGIERVGSAAPRWIIAARIAWVRLTGGRERLLLPQRVGDTINLQQLAFDGELLPVTQGTGFQNWPAVSASGEVLFTRSDITPSIWSLPLAASGEMPTREVSPGRMFGTSPDGGTLVFGRMLGTERGQLVLRDRARGSETVLASHMVRVEGAGSFWPQISPDGRRVVYRVNEDPGGISLYVVSTDGGAPRRIELSGEFSFVTGWSPDGRRSIGSCGPGETGLCELLPDTGAVRSILEAPSGGELLDPSFAWDGRWVAFGERRSRRTRVFLTAVGSDGTLAGEAQWVLASPADADGERPRFSPDGSAIFYELTRGNVVTLVRQALDPVSRRPIGEPVRLAAIRNFPLSVFYISLQSLITVTRDRVFFNTAEIRSNVWLTRIQ